jgi:hypothetical protein
MRLLTPDKRVQFGVSVGMALLFAMGLAVGPHWACWSTGHSCWSTDEQAYLRYAGLVLQLLGIGTAVVGVAKHLKLLRPEPLDFSIPTIHGVGHLYAPRFVVTGSSGEDRIAALETAVARIHADIDAVAQQMEKFQTELREAVESEQHQRKTALERLRVQHKDLRASALLPEAIGLIWLLVGVILSTIPAEVSAGLYKLWP